MKTSGRSVRTLRLPALVVILMLTLAAPHAAIRVDNFSTQVTEVPRYPTFQHGGKTLEEAINWVSNQGNVARIIDAVTRVNGGQVIHYIKVLTIDGAIRTYKIQGRT